MIDPRNGQVRLTRFGLISIEGDFLSTRCGPFAYNTKAHMRTAGTFKGANQVKSLHSSVGHNHTQHVGSLAESSLFGSTTRNMNFYHSTQKSLHGDNLATDSI